MNKGVTDSNVMFAQVKRAMLKNAKEQILAVDSTKFDQVGFSRVCGLDEINTVVTDVIPSDEWRKYFEANGVKCLYGNEEQRYSVCQ